MAGPTMQKVSTLLSKDISNYLINQQTWGGIIYNVKAYGAKGDGTTDDTAAVQSAVDAMDAGGILYFPEGDFIITSAINFGSKNVVVGYDPNVDITGIKHITKNGFQYSPYGLASGGLGNGRGGFLVGAVGRTGEFGMLLGMDGNPSWMTIMPIKPGSNAEVTIQPTYDLGYVDTNGTAVTFVSGTPFNTNWLGKNIYINDALYKVQSINSTTSITLTATAGVQSNVPYQKISTTGTGRVNTSGTTVTWLEGNVFAYFWAGSPIIINGVSYTIDSVVTDEQIILTGSAGIQTDVSYSFDQETSFDAAAIGINKKSGESEERIVIAAKAYGEYRIATVATGFGKHFPLFIDVGGSNALKINIDQTIEQHSTGNAQYGFFPSSGRIYYHIAKTNTEFVFFGDGIGDIYIVDSMGRMNFQKPSVSPSYAKAALPAQVVGGMIYVTDDVGGAVPAFSDGVNWRRVTDRAIIS